MKNTLHISNDKIDSIETAPGNGIRIVYDDIESGEGVELYEGDLYAETLTLDGNTAEISQSYLKGSILHFRLIDENSTPGAFIHVIYNKDGESAFYKDNEVTAINKYKE